MSLTDFYKKLLEKIEEQMLNILKSKGENKRIDILEKRLSELESKFDNFGVKRGMLKK